jgi:aspartyl-tRNA(Asn)/glutamyl-tRNA(Gln) amidotransferase subunit C
VAVTRADIEHVAHLARMALDEQRVPELVEQLNSILGHMEVLSRVKTDGVVGAASVGDAALPLREDGGPPIPLVRRLDQFAPKMRDGFFLVPRLATHESLGEDEQ